MALGTQRRVIEGCNSREVRPVFNFPHRLKNSKGVLRGFRADEIYRRVRVDSFTNCYYELFLFFVVTKIYLL